MMFHLIDALDVPTSRRHFGWDSPSDWLYTANQRSVGSSPSGSWEYAGEASEKNSDSGEDALQAYFEDSSEDDSSDEDSSDDDSLDDDSRVTVPSVASALVNEVRHDQILYTGSECTSIIADDNRESLDARPEN